MSRIGWRSELMHNAAMRGSIGQLPDGQIASPTDALTAWRNWDDLLVVIRTGAERNRLDPECGPT
jgi:hypothetical protein